MNYHSTVISSQVIYFLNVVLWIGWICQIQIVMMTYIVVMILIVTIPELWFVSLSYSVIFIKKYIYQKQTLAEGSDKIAT